MNSRTATCIIIMTMVGSGQCGSHYRLVKDKGIIIDHDGSSIARPVMHKAFYQCDREVQCTYVIQRKESQEYFVVYGEVSTEQMEELLTVWKKMTIIANLPEEVATEQLENLALGKPSALSGQYLYASNASLAVDGNNTTDPILYCAISGLQVKAWLIVDLLSSAIIRSVKILSVEENHRVMGAIDVRAGDSLINGGTGNPPCQLNSAIRNDTNVMDVVCAGQMIARYITINTSTLNPDVIQICELEVYGLYI